MAEKEPHYFAPDMPGRGRSVRVSSMEEYLSRFEGASNEPVRGDTSVWYLYSAEAANRIHSFDPDAKILCVLRDPIDVVLSLHQMNVVNTTETKISLNEALELESERQEGRSIPENTWLVWDLYYRSVVSFPVQIRRYFDNFGQSQVKIVLFENLVRETERVYRDVVSFLGVDTSFRPSFQKRNTSGKVRNLGVRRFFRSQQWMERLIGLFPSVLRRFGGEIVSYFSSSVAFERNPHSSVCNELREDLWPEVRELNRMLDADVTQLWSFPPPSESK